MNPDMIRTGDFMHRWCATLELPKDVQKAATNIAKMAVDLDIVPGRSPISVAAAAIYMASQVRSSGHFWECFRSTQAVFPLFMITHGYSNSVNSTPSNKVVPCAILSEKRCLRIFS